MEKKLINKYLEKLNTELNPIFNGLKLNEDSKKEYAGWNYKYAPFGKSHHWLSFGIIHDPKLEYWFNIGAIKYSDDFLPIKEKLIEIKESNEAFKILEKKGQFFIRAGIEFNNTDNTELEKGLNLILDVAKYALKELDSSGFLGLEKTDVTEPANSTTQNPIKCNACQTELEAGYKFCSNCGEKVELAPTVVSENSKEEQEVFKNKMEKLWEVENWEDLVKCFEEKFIWEELDLKNSDLTIPIQYYLRGLYKIANRETDALNLSKEVLNVHGCFDEADNEEDFLGLDSAMQLTIHAKTSFTYAYAARYLEDIDEIKSAIQLLGKYDSDHAEETIQRLEDKLKELTAPQVPQRYYFEITFTCKLKKTDQHWILTSKKIPKGTIGKGKLLHLSYDKNLSKNDVINFLELKYDDGYSLRDIFELHLQPKLEGGWADLTKPNIIKIELLGMENEYKNPRDSLGGAY